jgi:hypothetical protein
MRYSFTFLINGQKYIKSFSSSSPAAVDFDTDNNVGCLREGWKEDSNYNSKSPQKILSTSFQWMNYM